MQYAFFSDNRDIMQPNYSGYLSRYLPEETDSFCATNTKFLNVEIGSLDWFPERLTNLKSHLDYAGPASII